MTTRTSFHKTRLPNGVRVVTENHPGARALSCGIWVATGTRDESESEAGVSHFVEHLVFKGTKNRTAYEIARDLEAVGGEINAFTSREYTCFVTQTLHQHLDLSLDVLSDLVCRADFVSSDFEKEKQVVVQEIHMSEDNLEDHIYDLFMEKGFSKHPAGKSILGTEKSITGMHLKDVVRYYKRRYCAENIIVSVAGAVDHAEAVALVSRHLEPFKGIRSSSLDKKTAQISAKKPKLQNFRSFIEKPSEQVHILLGFPSVGFKDRFRFESYIVNTLLGGGMTSRLYQAIREKRGLVYSIYSHMSAFVDSGVCTIYAGAEAKNARKVADLILKELKKIKQDGIKRSDLDFFKTQVSGQILLGSDDVENRMNSIGVNEMIFGKYRSVDDVMKEIAAVSLDSVNGYIEEFLDLDKLGVLLLGSYKKADSKWINEFGA